MKRMITLPGYKSIRIKRKRQKGAADPAKPIKASKIVKNPDLLNDVAATYVMLKDASFIDSFENLIEAMNLLAERGWEAVSIAGVGSTSMYALLKRTSSFSETET